MLQSLFVLFFLLSSYKVFSCKVHSAEDVKTPFVITEENEVVISDFSKFDEQIKQIKKLKHVSIALSHKGIDIELNENPISWVQSDNEMFDAYLNQGIAYFHVFHYIDALRSFKEARKINPHSLYSIIGIIISYDELINDYRQRKLLIDSLPLSKDLVGNFSRREKLWYDLAVSIFKYSYFDDYQAYENIAKAYEALLIFDENDIETLTLATYISNLDNNKEEKYLKALEMDHNHIGANHYLIHFREGVGEAVSAIEYAENLAKNASYNAHAVHMLAHILPSLGRWSEAKKLFQKADQIHLNWAKKNEVQPTEDWHYLHNLHLLAVTRIALGEMEGYQMLKSACE